MPSPQPPAARMRFRVGAFTFPRTVLNTAFRMVSPFLPVFARGLGVDLPTIALAVTARSSVGLGSPLPGSMAEARGRQASMRPRLGRFLAWGPARRLGYRRPRMDGTVPVAGRARVGSCRTTVGGTAGGRAPSSPKVFGGGRTELDAFRPRGHC